MLVALYIALQTIYGLAEVAIYQLTRQNFYLQIFCIEYTKPLGFLIQF